MEQPRALPDVRGEAARKALVLQYITIGYNLVEGVIAVVAGLAAASVALVGFGVDSGVELVAALLIAVRLRAAIRAGAVDERKEYRALRFVALTFFALGGFINAAYARSFDDISIIPTFVLTPLTYLGGVFYSIHLLSPFWQSVSLANPILHMVNAFRYGILGVSDIHSGTAIGFMLLATAVLYLFCIHLLKSGRGLRQ